MYTDQEVDIMRAFHSAGLNPGRLISHSKSAYREAHPDHTVIFNSNVICGKHGKVWWGDLDLTLDGAKLSMVAEELSTELLVLRELDARFGNENISFEDAKEKAVARYGTSV